MFFSSRCSWKECGCERRLGAFAFVVLFLIFLTFSFCLCFRTQCGSWKWLHQEPGRLGSRVTRCFSMSLLCSSSFPRLQFLFLCFVLFLLVEVWLWGVTLKMTMRCTSWKMAVGGAGGN